MACNSCAKPYSLLRKEKGCPNCGYSYCSKCLNEKIYIPKLKSEAKVCAKCKKNVDSKESKEIIPPDAYFKRLGADTNESTTQGQNTVEDEIFNRLKKLKENNTETDNSAQQSKDQEIANRLQKIKGDMPKTSDSELQERLAKLRGVPIGAVQSQTVFVAPSYKTEQEQADDLMSQYLEEAKCDNQYKDEFDAIIAGMENRLSNIKGNSQGPSSSNVETKKSEVASDSKDEEEAIREIVAKMKSAASLEDDLPDPKMKELPFCEICNEDATMRCLGCKYLFCKPCFKDHKDDDDGCDRYELYNAPKTN